MGTAAQLPLPKEEASKGVFASLLLPFHLMPWKSHSRQQLEGGHGRIHLLCAQLGEHRWRPHQWGLSTRGASCECVCTALGGDQA